MFTNCSQVLLNYVRKLPNPPAQEAYDVLPLLRQIFSPSLSLLLLSTIGSLAYMYDCLARQPFRVARLLGATLETNRKSILLLFFNKDAIALFDCPIILR